MSSEVVIILANERIFEARKSAVKGTPFGSKISYTYNVKYIFYFFISKNLEKYTLNSEWVVENDFVKII